MERPVPFENPEYCPGAYVMHFYCKYQNRAHRHTAAYPGLFEESDQCETRGQALKQSRDAGWIIHRDGTATCPLCARTLTTEQTNG